MLFVNGRNAAVRERKNRAMNPSPFFLPNLIRGDLRLMEIEPELRYNTQFLRLNLSARFSFYFPIKIKTKQRVYIYILIISTRRIEIELRETITERGGDEKKRREKERNGEGGEGKGRAYRVSRIRNDVQRYACTIRCPRAYF